jgi:hypothetical protein
MCDFKEAQTNSIRNPAEDLSGSTADPKAKPNRFCASFAEYFSVGWLFKGFRSDDKNESAVSGLQSSKHDVAAVTSNNASPADLAVDEFFRADHSCIRHSLSAGENTVRFLSHKSSDNFLSSDFCRLSRRMICRQIACQSV